MVINIPIQIDEAKMEEAVQKDYEGKVLDEIVKYIKTTLTRASSNPYGDRATDGMRVLIEDRIDEFLKDHKDEVIEHASKLLADKLARSKKGKEILDGVCADVERREEGDK